MRILVALFFCSVSVAVAAETADALETARRFAAAGALHLALDRVVRAQPADPSAPGWAGWEALRVDLLGRLDRHQDVLARAAMLPPTLPPDQLRAAYRTALRAATALDRSPETRSYAARLLWQHGVSADELRKIRLLIIDSYLAEGRGDDAFLSMLRFEQDYRPVERTLAARFVEGLVDLGMARQAVNWLASLDDGGALKLRLHLEAGLIEPAAALAQARALAARNGSVDAWRTVAATAAKQNDRVLRVEALERVLHGFDTVAARAVAQARELWQAYDALTREVADRNQLLTGDDAGWGDFAARRLEESPAVARAFFGHLARNASAREIRHNAQLQLVRSLRGNKLGRTAVRLFEGAGLNMAVVEPEARRLLGDIAESTNQPAAALRYWQDLAPPPGSAADEWPLRVAAVAMKSGRPDAAAEAVRRALAGRSKLAADLVKRAADIVREVADAGRRDEAVALFEMLLPLAEPAARRQILVSLGGVNEASDRWRDAADYYLRAALLADPKAPDALALQARLAAARSLARAGYAGDARAQFEWLAKNAKDPVQIELARREIERLRR